jgi:hypothetical protein
MMPSYTPGGDKMLGLITDGKMASTAGHGLALRILANPPINRLDLLEVVALLDQVCQENMKVYDELEVIRAANSRRIKAARAREERKRKEKES